jgi:predicted outer membrane protein
MAHVNPIQVQKYLKGVDYPASKAALLEKARSMGADENICTSLEQLPDEEFETPADVSQAFGALPADTPPSGARRDKPAHEKLAHDKPAHGHARASREGHKDESRGADTRSSPGSNEFLVQAIQDSMAEIQICELALDKLGNEDAKAFAQSMIDEHGRIGRDLERLAAGRKLDMPRRIRPEQEMTVDELSSLEGRDFEQRWIQYNIDVHERDIKVLQHYAAEEYDPDIRKLARTTADTFGRHLKVAHDVGRKLAKV